MILPCVFVFSIHSPERFSSVPCFKPWFEACNPGSWLVFWCVVIHLPPFLFWPYPPPAGLTGVQLRLPSSLFGHARVPPNVGLFLPHFVTANFFLCFFFFHNILAPPRSFLFPLSLTLLSGTVSLPVFFFFLLFPLPQDSFSFPRDFFFQRVDCLFIVCPWLFLSFAGSQIASFDMRSISFTGYLLLLPGPPPPMVYFFRFFFCLYPIEITYCAFLFGECFILFFFSPAHLTSPLFCRVFLPFLTPRFFLLPPPRQTSSPDY